MIASGLKHMHSAQSAPINSRIPRHCGFPKAHASLGVPMHKVGVHKRLELGIGNSSLPAQLRVRSNSKPQTACATCGSCGFPHAVSLRSTRWLRWAQSPSWPKSIPKSRLTPHPSKFHLDKTVNAPSCKPRGLRAALRLLPVFIHWFAEHDGASQHICPQRARRMSQTGTTHHSTVGNHGDLPRSPHRVDEHATCRLHKSPLVQPAGSSASSAATSQPPGTVHVYHTVYVRSAGAGACLQRTALVTGRDILENMGTPQEVSGRTAPQSRTGAAVQMLAGLVEAGVQGATVDWPLEARATLQASERPPDRAAGDG